MAFYFLVPPAVGVVTGTAGRDSSCYRYYGSRRTRQLTSLIANEIELNWHTTYMKIRGSVVSLRFIFYSSAEVKKGKKYNKFKHAGEGAETSFFGFQNQFVFRPYLNINGYHVAYLAFSCLPLWDSGVAIYRARK